MNTKTAGEIYLDCAATIPVEPEVMEVMAPYFSRNFGNLSRLHGFGAQAKTAVENARAQVAGLIKVSTSEIIFTSGGTESNNAAIKGTALAMRGKGNHIITSSIEHSSVFEPCMFMKELGFDVTSLDVACSAGAACSSGGSVHYRVLKGLDLPPQFVRGSLRFAMGRYTRPEEIDRVREVPPSILEKAGRR